MVETEHKSTNIKREQRILDAAERLIIHYGYDKTTVSDIAREAGVSKGAVYLHWSSKEALFEALLKREIGRYGSDWLRQFEAEEGTWSFATMFRLMLLVMQDRPFIAALMKKDQRVLGSFLRQDSALMRQKFAANAGLFTVMQQAGAVRDDIPAEVIAYLLNLFAYGLVSTPDFMPPEDVQPLEDALDGLAKLLDRGLEPAGGGNREAGRAVIARIVEGMRAQSDRLA